MARFKRICEVQKVGDSKEWRLCFQYGTYHYDKGDSENGFRFIWKENDKLKPQRGQARIPSLKDLFDMLALASKDGWFDNKDMKNEMKNEIKCESYPYCLIVKLLSDIIINQK